MSSPKRLLELSLSVNGPYKMYGYGRHLEQAQTKSLKSHQRTFLNQHDPAIFLGFQ